MLENDIDSKIVMKVNAGLNVMDTCRNYARIKNSSMQR